MNALASYPSLTAFWSASKERGVSPEWDFGVHWHTVEEPWPTHRLSWVIETGELYLFRHGLMGAEGTVRVIAVIPKVGEYPYGTGRPYRWSEFAKAQDVERVLHGWAEQGGDLAWLEARLAAHTTRSEVVD